MFTVDVKQQYNNKMDLHLWDCFGRKKTLSNNRRNTVMPPKDEERMANSVDPDRTALIRLYTVCSDIHVPIFRIFTVQ